MPRLYGLSGLGRAVPARSVFRMKLHGLGDVTCAIDPNTGGRVCGTPSGPQVPAAPSVVPIVVPVAPATNCQQPRYLSFSITTKVNPQQTGGPTGFDNNRTFTFQYQSGNIDVYYTPTQTVQNGVSYQYMMVYPGGNKSTPGGPPPPQSCASSVIQPVSPVPLSPYTATGQPVINPVTGQVSNVVSSIPGATQVVNPATGQAIPQVTDPATGMYFSQEYPASLLNPATGYPYNYNPAASSPYGALSPYGAYGTYSPYGYGTIQPAAQSTPSNYVSSVPATASSAGAASSIPKWAIYGGIGVAALLAGKFMFGKR